jgi:DNA mismatch endonuclease (patch repair protein)
MRRVARTTTEPVDPARSAQMARVRGRDTKPELQVRRALHAAGLRFRLQAKDLPGRPDIVFRRAQVAVFVHGCFWHRHEDPACKRARMPKSRVEFWTGKLDGNRARDARNLQALRDLGWSVIVVWECRLAGGDWLEEIARAVSGPPSSSPPR